MGKLASWHMLLGCAAAVWCRWSEGAPRCAAVTAGAYMEAHLLQAALVMHELGHTRDLHHGGHDLISLKPNYQA